MEINNIWKLNSTHNESEKKNHRKIRKCLERNDSKSTTYQNLWDTEKAVLKGNLYQLIPFSLKKIKDLRSTT